jgi:MFS family permease
MFNSRLYNLFRQYPRIIGFGLITTFFASTGQTFLISLFVPQMERAFELSHSKFSALYSAATVSSAFLLPITGRLLDRLSLKKFTIIIAFGLSAGCFILFTANHFFVLFFGFLVVRWLGQGTFSITATATMARVFSLNRGKALSIVGLGPPLGEAIYPALMVPFIAAASWRMGWLVVGAVILLVYLPLSLYLLSHSSKDPDTPIEKPPESKKGDYSVRDVLREANFYFLILPTTLAPFLLTLLFFHQVTIIEMKGWGLSSVATGLFFFALFRFLSGFMIGGYIDRYSSRKLFPISLLPLLIGLLIFYGWDHQYAYFVWMGLAGISVGSGGNIKSALWAELYGVKCLGAIRGVTGSLMVVATAIGPVIMGYLLDLKVPFDQIQLMLIGAAVFSISLAVIEYFLFNSKFTERS